MHLALAMPPNQQTIPQDSRPVTASRSPASFWRSMFANPLWRRPATVFWVGLFAREVAIFVGHTYRVSKLEGSFGFGWETGRIARSIALGQGFSSPFQPGTGPTAWLAPTYPYLLAAVFKVFGIYTTTSGIAILSINSVFSALTILPVFYIAQRTFGSRAAVWSSWLAAMLPYAWYWAIKWAWETSLATLLLACVFLLALRMADIESRREKTVEIAPCSRLKDWLLFGLLWGTIALTNPSLLLWLPLCALWLLILQVRTEQSPRAFWHAMASGFVFVAMLSPWITRNYLVFHRFIPVRSNFGAELHMGNAEGAVGLWRAWMHPSVNAVEFQKYKELGELEYVKMNQREALEFIRLHPGAFATLSLRRAVYYWYGTLRDSGNIVLSEGRNIGYLLSSLLAFGGLWAMWRKRNPATFLYASLLFAVPLIYYVTFAYPRYRAPIEPEMLVLMVGLFLYAEPRARRNPE